MDRRDEIYQKWISDKTPRELEYCIKAAMTEYKEDESDAWIHYDWNDLKSRPKETGKYFVYRKDGKVHWETWNGSGWAYNNNVITRYKKITPPNPL